MKKHTSPRKLSAAAGLSLLAASAASAQLGPINRWSFSETSGATAADSAGFRKAFIRGPGSTWDTGKIKLPGGASGTAPYVDLPNFLVSDRAPELNGSGKLSIEIWFTVVGARTWSRVFDFGNTDGNELFGPGSGGEGRDYLMLTALTDTNAALTRLELRNRSNIGRGAAGAGGPDVTAVAEHVPPVLGTQRHVVVTWEDGVGLITYEAGAQISTLDPQGMKMVHNNDLNNWLGRSNWPGDANMEGTFDEMRVYDRILAPAEVAQHTIDGPDGVLTAPPDADADNLPDWFERKYLGGTLDPAVTGTPADDQDADGLTNLAEFQNNTNPTLTDTDGDGLSDGAEITAMTDPNVADTDGDGLSDGDEVNVYTTNPLIVDTDMDSYTDGAEVAAGSNPKDANSIPVIFLANRYSFSAPDGVAVNGDLVQDTVTGENGHVRGDGATWNAGTLALPGGGSDTAPYVDLPNGLISRFSRGNGGRGSVTIEGWLTIPSGGNNWQRIFDFGSNQPGGTLGEVFAPGRTHGGPNGALDFLCYDGARGNDNTLRKLEWQNNDRVGGAGGSGGGVDFPASTGTLDAEYHFAVVVDEALSKVVVYENGVLVSTLTTSLQLSSINDVNCWIGRSNFFGDAGLTGTLNEFRIYAGAMSAADVVKSMNKGPDTLPGGATPATDITTLKIQDASGWPAWYVDRNPVGLPAPGSDSDSDQLTALQELARGSDPTKADTDGDGLPDTVETGTGVYVSATDTGTRASAADVDRDGLNDMAELTAGTDPYDMDSDDDLVLDSSDPLPLSPAVVATTPAHQWKFNDLPEGVINANTQSADVVGGAGFEAFIRGAGGNALAGGSVRLPGQAPNDANATYIDLPNGLISGQSRVTLAGWYTLQGNPGNWSRVFSFGASGGLEVPPAAITNGTSYLFLTLQRDANQTQRRLAMLNNTIGGESFYDTDIPPNTGTEVFFAVTVDSTAGDRSVVSYYEDGEYRGGVENAGNQYVLSQINDVNNWLGRSQFPDAPSQIDFNEFRIYNGVLNRNALTTLYKTGPEGLRILDAKLFSFGATSEVELTWSSRPNAVYTVESSQDLATWTPFSTGNVAFAVTTTQIIPVEPGRKYFRVRLE